MQYAPGDLFEVTDPVDLFVDFRQTKSELKVRLMPPELGMILKDNGAFLSGTDTYVLFVYVMIRGRTGWIMDDCIKKVNVV